MDSLALDRLAVRIETLIRQDTRNWMPGDALEFQRALPSTHGQVDPRQLPSPDKVRQAAYDDLSMSSAAYRNALQVCLRLESLVHQNRPGNPRRMMHDVARGRFPWGR